MDGSIGRSVAVIDRPFTPHHTTPHQPPRLARDLEKRRQAADSQAAASEEGRQERLERWSLQAGSHVSQTPQPTLNGEWKEGDGGWGSDYDDGEDGESGFGDDEDEEPFTLAQLQERTRAARAAVNILLPDRTDGMAGREGPYAVRRRGMRERR